MTWWEILFSIYAALAIVINFALFIFVMDDNWEVIPELVNPIAIYKITKVNYFGCFVLTIFYNVIFVPFAVGYWFCKICWLFYKLCTVGRR